MEVRSGAIVGCDLDGVIADIVQQLVRFARFQHRIRLSKKHIVSENIEKCAPIRQDQLHQMFKTPAFFRSLPAFYGARKSLSALRTAGCTIHIVTDRFWYDGIREDTIHWLERHRIPFDSVSFARKAEKQDVARNLNISWFIEDQLSNAQLLSPLCQVILLNRPYNAGETPVGVTRVDNLQQAVTSITESESISSHRRERLSTALPFSA